MIDKAIQWIKRNSLPGGGMIVHSRKRVCYPEVTGYFIPTLLSVGERQLAIQYGEHLCNIQQPDGSFLDPDGKAPYAFDTGQVIRGWNVLLPSTPTLEQPLRRACNWLISSADQQTGRLLTPDGAAWSMGARGIVSEGVHLYALWAMQQAGELLKDRAILDFVKKSKRYYLANVDLTTFEQKHMLTHLFCYIQEALFDLGEIELASKGMAGLAGHQQENGALPAFFDVPWICAPGQIQAASVWYKLGDRERADRTLAFAEKCMNPSGGFFGSYGVGATYFPNAELSWAVKFYLDATALRSASSEATRTKASSPTPTVGRPADNGHGCHASQSAPTVKSSPAKPLDAVQWHEAITAGAKPKELAARVRAGQIPEWIQPILEATKPGDVVLELGSGTGGLSACLAAQGRRVVGCDYSQESLAFAQQVFAEIGQLGTFLLADIRQRFPLADQSVDVVWSSGVLEHFSDDEIVHILTESARVARRTVLSLVPNAVALSYRLGKWQQERVGQWPYGYEDPKFSLTHLFSRAGLVDGREYSVAPLHALNFLTEPAFAGAREGLRAFFQSLPVGQLRALNQGYLLVSEGHKRKLRRLVVVPNDPLQAYIDAGYPDLTEYFNPCGYFDQVYCLSKQESRERFLYGMKILPTAQEDFARRVKELRADVVRAYDLPAGTYACANRPEVPVLVSVHDVDPKRVPPSNPDADAFLSISEAVTEFMLQRGARPDQIWRYANRVNTAVFHPLTDARGRAEFERQFPGKYRIVHVGRKHRQKNLETLLQALPLLGPDYTAIFVGKGEAGPYQELARKLGVANRCHWVDAVKNEDLAVYYSFCDCMCTPSRWEGFGIVFIEALACGAVVVTSDVKPMKEYIEHGVSGLLVKAFEDPVAVAAMVKSACADAEVRSRIKAGARQAALPFSKPVVDAREVEIYRAFVEPSFREIAGYSPETELGKQPPQPVPWVRRASYADGLFRVPLTPDLRNEWEALVKSSPEGWLYHWYDEQELIEETWRAEMHSFLVNDGSCFVGLVPLHRHRNSPFLDSTCMGPGGPAMGAELEPAQREALWGFINQQLRQRLGALKETGVTALRVFLPPLSRSRLADWREEANPLVPMGYQDESTRTAILDLAGRTLDDLFKGLRDGHRYDIRKAEKSDVEVCDALVPADIEEYYRLHVETYTRTGVRPHPKPYFENIFRRFTLSGRTKTMLARYQGQAVAGINLARFGDTALYWTGANAGLGLKLGAGKLLLWRAIQWAQQNGIRWFEVGEVFEKSQPGTKLAGLTAHKSGYGGEIHPFFKGVLKA